MSEMKKSSGITLTEMLIATAILGIILTALTSLFSGSSKGMTVNKELSDRQQNAATAEQVLKYEIGLAGYRGVDEDFLEDNTFDDATLAITRGADDNSPDTITVRYYEDRLYGEGEDDVLREVTFGISEEDDTSYLTRQEGDNDTQLLVEGVTNLKATRYFKYDGEDEDLTDHTTVTGIVNTTVALELQLSFDSGPDKTIVVSFQNPLDTSLSNQTVATGQ